MPSHSIWRSTRTCFRRAAGREIVHAVQNARKSAGLQVEDRIELALTGDPLLIAAAEVSSEYLTSETLAVQLYLDEAAKAAAAEMDYTEIATVDGLELVISLKKARLP